MFAKHDAIDVRVSQRILWLGSEAYPLHNITHTNTVTLAPNRSVAIKRYVISVVLLLVLAAVVVSVASAAVGILVSAAVLSWIAAKTIRLAKFLSFTMYELVIETTAGSHRGLVSNNGNVVTDLAMRITDAINNPMAEFQIRVENFYVGDNINMYGDSSLETVKSGVRSTRSHSTPKSGSQPPKKDLPDLAVRVREPGPAVVLDETTLPVTIYLADEAASERVETAVEALLRSAGLEVLERDEPILGSWFRRIHAGRHDALRSPLAREAAAVAAHALESRAVLAQDAAVTATMMQNLGPLLTSLQPTKDAVIRVGAILIVKVEWVVAVHQLTSAQQLHLDHQPRLLTSPRDILQALELSDDGESTAASLGDVPWLLPNEPDRSNNGAEHVLNVTQKDHDLTDIARPDEH